MSRSWQRLQNTTSVQKISITHASAECQAYQIIFDKFILPPLNKDFIEGAIQRYQHKDWTEFIEQFGTHFINQITMGGRATQEISYTFDSVSKMQSLNVDLNITAKASFAKFFADASFDWHKYTKNIEYEQKILTSKKQLYIGGQPPRNGNIYDWQVKIIDNPMPITYKMLPLSELLNKIKDPIFNNSFFSYLKIQFGLIKIMRANSLSSSYSRFPKPPPAFIVTQKTPLYGNAGGINFQQYVNSTTMQLRKVLIRSGAQIDNIQLFLSDGIAQKYTSAVGGMGGSTATWDVPENQYVNQIQYRSGERIDSLTFITNKGKKSPKFGGNGGSYHLVTIPQDYRIVGFYGVQGARVYKLGFILAKTIYPPKQSFTKLIQIQQ